MQESIFYQFVYSLLRKPCGQLILAVILLFVPLVNLFFYVALWWALFFYLKANRVFQHNLALEPELLQQHFIYSQELCEMMSVRFHFFEIQADGAFLLIAYYF